MASPYIRIFSPRAFPAASPYAASERNVHRVSYQNRRAKQSESDICFQILSNILRIVPGLLHPFAPGFQAKKKGALRPSVYQQTLLGGLGDSKIPHIPIKFGDLFAEFVENTAPAVFFTQ
jgi:hypothetical protein